MFSVWITGTRESQHRARHPAGSSPPMKQQARNWRISSTKYKESHLRKDYYIILLSRQIETSHKMAPTEQQILSNYLLVPAQLPSIISLQEFIALFPRQLQSSPQIRSLYRDLQSQRNAVVDHVAEQIDEEAKQGKAMRRAVIRSKREAEAQELDDEVEIERMVSFTSFSFRVAQQYSCEGKQLELTPSPSWETGLSLKTQNTAWPPFYPTWRAPLTSWKPSSNCSTKRKPLFWHLCSRLSAP